MSIMKHEGEFDAYPMFRNGEQVRSCPFCCNALEIKTKDLGTKGIGYYAACSNPSCTIKGPIFSIETDAVKWWNSTHDFVGRYKNRME